MKKVKSIISMALIGSMLFSFAGCGIKEYDKKGVKEVLNDKLDLEKDDDYRVSNGKDADKFYGSYGKADFTITIYDDEDDAYDAFEIIYEFYEDDIEDECYEGKTKTKIKDDNGFVTINAECVDDGLTCTEKYSYYRGIYYSGCMIVSVGVTSDKKKEVKDSAREDVQEFVKAFGFDKP